MRAWRSAELRNQSAWMTTSLPLTPPVPFLPALAIAIVGDEVNFSRGVQLIPDVGLIERTGSDPSSQGSTQHG